MGSAGQRAARQDLHTDARHEPARLSACKLYFEYGPVLIAKDIHWQYWHHGDAQATANLIGCDVGCFGLGHVTLHFYDARYLRMNGSEYVKVHIIHANSGLGARYWHWDASGDTWEG